MFIETSDPHHNCAPKPTLSLSLLPLFSPLLTARRALPAKLSRRRKPSEPPPRPASISLGKVKLAPFPLLRWSELNLDVAGFLSKNQTSDTLTAMENIKGKGMAKPLRETENILERIIYQEKYI